MARGTLPLPELLSPERGKEWIAVLLTHRFLSPTRSDNGIPASPLSGDNKTTKQFLKRFQAAYRFTTRCVHLHPPAYKRVHAGKDKEPSSAASLLAKGS